MRHRKRRSHRRRHRRNPESRRTRVRAAKAGWRKRTHRRTHRRKMRRNPVYFSRRRTRRRGYHRLRLKPISLRGVGGSVRELLSKDTLTIAGGAVLGGLAASWIMSKWGPVKLVNGVATPKTAADGFVLPGSASKYGPLIYSVAIPLLGAAVTPIVLKGNAGKNLSRGMLIGSAVLLIQNVVNVVQSSMTPVAGTGAYVTGGRIRTLGAPQSAIAPVSANPLSQRSSFRGF